MFLAMSATSMAYANPCEELTVYQHHASPPSTFFTSVIPELVCRSHGVMACNAAQLSARKVSRVSQKERILIEKCKLRTPPPMEYD